MIFTEILNTLIQKKETIDAWFYDKEHSTELPFYSSADIRYAGFKCAVVDTNLFPAGFNNLCINQSHDAQDALRSAILRRNPNCREVLIITEEHTRNKFYLENIYVLKSLTESAGFSATIATLCEKMGAAPIEVETQTGRWLTMHCVKTLMQDSTKTYDLVILNNDLIAGIPPILNQLSLPIYPPLEAGWHTRSKTKHFAYSKKYIQEFSQLLSADPWLFSSYFDRVDAIDINQESDQEKLHDHAAVLFEKIQKKYSDYKIESKPYVFLKADSGTYGMGVLPIETPDKLRELNRKNRNKLTTGKGASAIHSFILQEGIPTQRQIDNQPMEACIYHVVNRFVGGFYRTNNRKNDRQSLNSPGMSFIPICQRNQCKNDGKGQHIRDLSDAQLYLYQCLARIGILAAQNEIDELVDAQKK